LHGDGKELVVLVPLLLDPHLLLLKVLLLAQLALVAFPSVGSYLFAQGSQEGLEFLIKILLGDAQVEAEEGKELALHEVDLLAGEAEVVVRGLHDGIVGPVLVLGRAIVQVLGGNDQRSEEDAVDRTPETLGLGLQALLQASEINQGRHEGRDLNVRGDDQLGDEVLHRGQTVASGHGLARRRKTSC